MILIIKNGNTALFTAVSRGDFDMAECLLMRGNAHHDDKRKVLSQIYFAKAACRPSGFAKAACRSSGLFSAVEFLEEKVKCTTITPTHTPTITTTKRRSSRRKSKAHTTTTTTTPTNTTTPITTNTNKPYNQRLYQTQECFISFMRLSLIVIPTISI